MSPLPLRQRDRDAFALPPNPETKFLARRRGVSIADHYREVSSSNERHSHRRKHRPGSSRDPKHSIHLDSAPWLGYGHERASQAVRDSALLDAGITTAPYLRRRTSEYEQQQQQQQQLSNRARTTTNGSSGSQPQTSLRSTASSADSMLSSSSRSLLQCKAVQISHALVRRANEMIKSVERSRALAAGSRRSRSLEIEGYRFLHMSKSGTAVYEDATVVRLDDRASSQPRYIGVAAVKATIDEFIDTFGHDSELGFSQLHPDVTSCRQLHSISEQQDRRIGVKWMAMMPTWTGSLARRRDFVVLDCEEVFSTDNGGRSGGGSERRGWVHTMHSVQLPWCPPMEKSASIVRASMYQTGTVVLESEASPEWLHVVSIVELDMKGSATERSQRANALRRIASLEVVAPTLVERRVQRMSMLRTKQFNAAKPPKEAHCSVCTQRVGITSLRLHHYCRKCAATVCSSCSSHWQLDAASKKKTRICGVCVMATRPSRVSTSSWIGSAVGGGEAIRSSSRRAEEEHRASRAQTLPEGLPRRGAGSRADPNLQSVPQNLNRANSVPTSRRRASRRYFDLPMDASELSPLSDDDDDSGDNNSESDCTSETIYPLGIAGALAICHDASKAAASKMVAGGGDRASGMIRFSQSVTEDEDDEMYDSENGHSVGPSASYAAAAAAASEDNPNQVYMRDDEIHL